jgi:sigma-B regulation protein RsbU (phosphoserine phosphatase)
MLNVTGFPIGLAPEAEEFNQQSIVLEPGDRLLMYTDGLPDTMNEDGEIFGAGRLLESVTQHNRLPLDEMIRALMSDLGEWRGETDVKDDVSILSVEVV